MLFCKLRINELSVTVFRKSWHNPWMLASIGVLSRGRAVSISRHRVSSANELLSSLSIQISSVA